MVNLGDYNGLETDSRGSPNGNIICKVQIVVHFVILRTNLSGKKAECNGHDPSDAVFEIILY